MTIGNLLRWKETLEVVHLLFVGMMGGIIVGLPLKVVIGRMTECHKAMCQETMLTQFQTGQERTARQFVLVGKHQSESHVKKGPTLCIMIQVGDVVSHVGTKINLVNVWKDQWIRFSFGRYWWLYSIVGDGQVKVPRWSAWRRAGFLLAFLEAVARDIIYVAYLVIPSRQRGFL